MKRRLFLLKTEVRFTKNGGTFCKKANIDLDLKL